MNTTPDFVSESKGTQRHASILEATQLGTWEWNVNADRFTVDAQWAHLIGYTLEELGPIAFPDYMRYFHEEDLIRVKALMQDYFEQKQDHYEAEFRMRHKQGHWVWILSRGKVVSWSPDQKPLLMYGTHQEITVRKASEARMQHLLEITQAQNARLKNFARIVSHNLRSHAFSIQGGLEMFTAKNPEWSGDKILGMLQNTSHNLSETLEELNDVVASDLSLESSKIPLPLSAVIAKNRENLLSSAQKWGVKILNQVPQTELVYAVPAYLNSLVLNLMSNAIKYAEPSRESFVKISLQRQKTHDQITFEDNGQGIDLEKYGDKLFEMYQTFHRHEDSRGIGLYITRNQIETMGGTITVKSEPDVGTTFQVRLPAVPEELR